MVTIDVLDVFLLFQVGCGWPDHNIATKNIMAIEFDKLGLGSKMVHAGPGPDPLTGAVMQPIYQTSTYAQSSPGHHKGYEYARSQNPTRSALENTLAAIEIGKHALAFASGVAATDAVLKLLSPGDEVVAANDMYGGTYRLFTKQFEKYGIIFRFVDATDVKAISDSLTQATKLVWIETPTNPLMSITDIAAVAELTRAKGILLCIDNTFASPFLQNPLSLGADISLHSATKYLGGHSDVVQGALVVNDLDLYDKLYFIQKSSGAVPGPQDCFLVMRGIKTLHLRMERHCSNGSLVANFLRKHPLVGRTWWCGFEDHPGHAIAKKQMRGFGGMMSFELRDNGKENTFKVLSSTKIFTLAESLGGVESLINHPATMTHASIPREQRLANGLSDGLIRLSVGIEDPEDLITDLAQAIGQAS